MTPVERDRPSDDRYEISGAMLRSLDHGMGRLSINGVLEAHLATTLMEMTFPRRAPWPWFVVVWLDGTKEPAFEDYGPDWETVRELETGKFSYAPGPGRAVRKRLLGVIPYSVVRSGPDVTFDFEWLPPADAAVKWTELGLDDGDF